MTHAPEYVKKLFDSSIDTTTKLSIKSDESIYFLDYVTRIDDHIRLLLDTDYLKVKKVPFAEWSREQVETNKDAFSTFSD